MFSAVTERDYLKLKIINHFMSLCSIRLDKTPNLPNLYQGKFSFRNSNGMDVCVGSCCIILLPGQTSPYPMCTIKFRVELMCSYISGNNEFCLAVTAVPARLNISKYDGLLLLFGILHLQTQSHGYPAHNSR